MKQQPDYHLEPMDDELLLYHPNQTQILYCNPSASLIWQLCDGQHTAEMMIDLLQTAYPRAYAQIPADVSQTLAQFAEHGAIRYVD